MTSPKKENCCERCHKTQSFRDCDDCPCHQPNQTSPNTTIESLISEFSFFLRDIPPELFALDEATKWLKSALERVASEEASFTKGAVAKYFLSRGYEAGRTAERERISKAIELANATRPLTINIIRDLLTDPQKEI